MKKHEIYFWIIRVPLDFLIVFCSFFFAAKLRTITDWIPDVHLPIQNISQESLLYFALFWALLFVIIAGLFWIYKIKISNSKVQEVFDLVKIILRWFLFYIWIVYLSNWFIYHEQIPRLIILFTAIISIFLISSSRIILNIFHNLLLNKWLISRQNILLIQDDFNLDIIKDIKKAKIYNIMWYVNSEQITHDYMVINHREIKYLWWKEFFLNLARDRKIDEVLLLWSWFSKQDEEEIFEISRIYWIRYRFAANLFEVSKSNARLTFLFSLPFVEIENIWLTPWWSFIKRIIDISFSFILLLFLFPVFIIITLLIYLWDFSNPFYKDIRVWRNWKQFNQYKFRSMKINADLEKNSLLDKNERWGSPLFKIKNDSRITKFWKFLRKYSIDELPQLINVLKWDMSLIWPRPHLPDEISKYKEYQKRVLTIKPWISWMAQVNWRHNNSFEEEIKLDTSYIENWWILLDAKIFLKTIFIVFMWTWE